MPKRPAKKPDAAYEAALEKIRAKFGATSAVIPGKQAPASEVKEVIPTGIDVVDHYVLGCGGWPVGRCSEVFCDEGGGKTTLVWSSLANAQRLGYTASYADSERSWNTARARQLGLDPDRLLLTQPWTLEEALEQQDFLFNSALKGLPRPMLHAWDSVAEAGFKGDFTGKYDKESADDRAKKIGKFCRAVCPVLPRERVHLLFVNQTRELRGVMFGPNTTTPGGKAIKFYASHRLQLFPGKSLKDSLGQHVGMTITFLAVKNRFAPRFRKAKVRLDYARGWDNAWTTINHAKDLKLVPDATKVDEPGYTRAVAALGWKTAAPWAETAAGRALEEGESPEEKALDDWLAVEGKAAQDREQDETELDD